MQISKLIRQKKGNKADCNKTTNNYQQNPVSNGFEAVSELEDVSESRYHNSSLGYENVDWFVDEIKSEIKMNFYFKNTKKDIIMTKKDKDFKNKIFFRFCEKKYR